MKKTKKTGWLMNTYCNIIETAAFKKSEKDLRRGYPVDAYVIFRWIWSAYWTAFVAGGLFFTVPGQIIPFLSIAYAESTGLASMEDLPTILSLYFVPYLFAVAMVFAGCIVLIKFVRNYFKKRNEFLITTHFNTP